MAEEGGGGLVGGDAAAVVTDPDEGHAAVLNFHCDSGGSGINGVFHEFLDHRGRAFHHFAGGDEVGHMGGELSDDWHRVPPELLPFGQRGCWGARAQPLTVLRTQCLKWVKGVSS